LERWKTMKTFLIKSKIIVFFVLATLLILVGCWEFLSIDQPETADPNSAFDVPITIVLTPEEGSGRGYFGIQLPVGWSAEDSIRYTGVLDGTFIYSKDQSDSMETHDPSLDDYYWCIFVSDSVDSLPEGNFSFTPRIKTNDQRGLFFINYMISDRIGYSGRGRGEYMKYSGPHPISVGLLPSVTVTNINDSGAGSLRQALNDVQISGEITFNLDYPATILLESQLVIDRNVTLYGPELGELIISCDKKDRIFYVNENLNVSFSDFTISGGYLAGEEHGGGIYCYGSTLNLTSVNINNCSAYSGGGIFNHNSEINLSNVIIKGNSALLGGGGGISCVGGDLFFNNILIVSNIAADEGGGIECRGSTLNLTNCTIANNNAREGSGIFYGYSKGTIANSIIWKNLPESISLKSSYVKTSYSDIQGGFIGEHNLDSDPLFSDLENFYLGKGSPCIDSGNPDSLFNDYEDPNNNGFALWPALGNIRNDMGAYGGHGKFRKVLWDFTSEVEIKTVDFINEKIGWMAGPGTMLKTENGGESWENIPTELDFHRIDFVNEFVGWAIGNGSIVYRTEDGGKTWRRLKRFRDDYDFTSISAVDDKIVYIVAIVTGTPYPCGAIVKSLDSGASWQEITPAYDRWDLESVWAIDGETCVISGRSSSWGGGILRTFDGGKSWDEKKVSEFDGIYDLQFINDSTGYFLADEHKLFQTKKTCSDWIHRIDDVTSYCTVDGTVFAIIKNKFMKSVDEGKTWEGIYLGLEDHLLIKFTDSSTGWIIGVSGTVLKTIDGGTTWIDQSLGNITHIKNEEHDSRQLLLNYTLSQNYPNPFNPSTTIKYQISKLSQVDLSIYNILGQKMATLVSEKQSAGTFKVEWDASGLSGGTTEFTSGLYIYRLQTNNQVVSKKMLLLK